MSTWKELCEVADIITPHDKKHYVPLTFIRHASIIVGTIEFDKIRSFVEAANLFITGQGGHPYTGACDTDHNIGWGCNCGYYKAIAALKDLGVTNEVE